MFLNVLAPGLDRIAHQKREHAVGFDGIFQCDLDHLAFCRIHCRVPELVVVHFTESFVTVDGQSLAAVALDLFRELFQRADLELTVVVDHFEKIVGFDKEVFRIVTGRRDFVVELFAGFRLIDRCDINGRMEGILFQFLHLLFEFIFHGGGDIRGGLRRLCAFLRLRCRRLFHFRKTLERFVDELVLRATYGVTGEQGFQAYQALQMYNYSNSMRIYQSSDVVGTLLYGMGNPDLKWQTTDSWNVGLDFTLFNNRLSGRFEYYYKLTENTVLDYSLAPSIGFNTIKDNVGNISNEGYEFTLRWMPYYNVAQQMNLSFVVNGSHNKNTIKKISNALRARNEEQMQEDPDNPNKLSRPLPRYEEGYSQSMIWAVRSLGIDPITGREIFLTRDGERTSEWNAADQVPVGDTEPDLQGTMSLNFNWKGLSVNVAAQYKFGGQYYNKTLVDKVENADLRYNVDHRAYTDRWQNVGDLAVFKAVTQDVNGSQTKASTRFLMDQNELVLNTINIQYRFEQRYTPWIKKLGLSSASVGLYMEDLFHWSTIKQERGIEYPMSRQISMSLNLTF